MKAAKAQNWAVEPHEKKITNYILQEDVWESRGTFPRVFNLDNA
jgi:hypothetical protein